MSSGHVFLDGLGVADGLLIRSLQLFNAERHGLELSGRHHKGMEATPKGFIDFHLPLLPTVWKTFGNYQQCIAGIYLFRCSPETLSQRDGLVHRTRWIVGVPKCLVGSGSSRMVFLISYKNRPTLRHATTYTSRSACAGLHTTVWLSCKGMISVCDAGSVEGWGDCCFLGRFVYPY